jgi:hypothetical protein
MSENNINPEQLADEELDDVSGGGCCGTEELNNDDYIPCPKGYEVRILESVNLDKCSDCKYILKMLTPVRNKFNKETEIVDWWCDRPKK